MFDRIFSPSLPALERLDGYFRYVFERQAALKEETGKVLGCPNCAVGTEICLQEDAIRQKVQEIANGVQRYYENVLRDAHAEGVLDAPNPAAKAKIFYAWFQGTMTQARIENNLELVRGMREGAYELLSVRQPASAARA